VTERTAVYRLFNTDDAPAELAAWARAEADRRGVNLSDILTEALSDYRAKTEESDR
jgi:hypothetical protein